MRATSLAHSASASEFGATADASTKSTSATAPLIGSLSRPVAPTRTGLPSIASPYGPRSASPGTSFDQAYAGGGLEFAVQVQAPEGMNPNRARQHIDRLCKLYLVLAIRVDPATYVRGG